MKSDTIAFERRPLGNSGFSVSPVALGCWPIAGVTTLDTNDADSIATIQKCFDVGINHLDTAYVYGPNGESENLIRRALGSRRDEMVIATKCGIHYEGSEMVTDGRPERLRPNATNRSAGSAPIASSCSILHAPDENVPIAESAGALRELMDAGKTRSVGVSNFTVEQMEEFSAVCPITAVQMPYNMLQRDIEQRTIPWCRERNIAVMVYWPLMKGLLAGKLAAQRGTRRARQPPQIPWIYRRRVANATRISSIGCAKRPHSPGTRSRSSSSIGRSASPASRAHCAARSARLKSKRRPARWAGRSATINCAIIDAAIAARGKAAATREFE